MIASYRWLGQRPEGPGAEVIGKVGSLLQRDTHEVEVCQVAKQGEDPGGVSLVSLEEVKVRVKPNHWS